MSKFINLLIIVLLFFLFASGMVLAAISIQNDFDFGGTYKILNLPTTGYPTNLGDAATKAYVDSVAGGAPIGATYITQTPNITLTAEQALSALSTGILKVTTGTGVVSSLTGTANYIPKWSDSGTLSGTSNIFDNGTNVAVGTNSPSERLTVQSVSGDRGMVHINQVGADNWAGLKIDRDGSEVWFVGVSNADNTLRLRRNGASDDLVINSSGNVGIGTAPNYRLDVAGGDINVAAANVYRRGGTAGVSVSCGPENTPSGITVSGGIVTSAGACVAIGGGAQNIWSTISTPLGTSPVPDSTTDTLTLSAGSGISITGDAVTDTITIANTGLLTTTVFSAVAASDTTVAGTYNSLNIQYKAGSILTADIADLNVTNAKISEMDWVKLQNYPASATCPAGQFVTQIGDAITCAAPPSGTIGGGGTATQVAFFTATPSTIGSSANLYWDNTNSRLGVAQASPGAKLTVNNPTTAGKVGSTGDAIYAYSSSATGAAISGEQANASGYAGYFSGKAYVSTNLTIGGLVSCPNLKTDAAGLLQCNTTVYLTSESDPQVNTLTAGKWCTTDGTVINCTSDAPASGVSSVSAANATLTISPTTGAVLASLNLANANTWTGAQTFSANTNFPGSGIWNTSGNVGIGTTSPGAQLHLADIYTAGGKNLLIGDDTFLTDIDTANTLGIYGNQDNTIASIKLGDRGGVISGYNGNVGIGTTSPGTKLDVAGRAKMTEFQLGASTTAGYVLTADASGVGTWQAAADGGLWTDAGTYIYANNTTNVVVTDTGNVGIGTTAPAGQLHLYGGAGAPQIARFENSGDGIVILRLARQGNVKWDIASYPSFFDDRFSIRSSAGDERLVILQNGNVGIGTTSPNRLLTTTGTFFAGGSATGIEISGTTIRGAYAPGGAGLGEIPVIINAPGLSTTSLQLQTGGTTRVTVAANGNVGIGQTAPVAKLVINKDLSSAGGVNDALGVYASTTGSAIYAQQDGTGYAGFFSGKAYISTNLEVAGQIKITGGSPGLGKVLTSDAAGLASWQAAPTGGGWTDDGAVVRLTTSTDNVGIGTDAPTEKLSITKTSAGNLAYALKLTNYDGINPGTATGILFNAYSNNDMGKGALVYVHPESFSWGKGDFHFLQNSVSSTALPTLSDSVMTIKNNGNVGIGTTSPGAKLQIDTNFTTFMNAFRMSYEGKTTMDIMGNGEIFQYSGATLINRFNSNGNSYITAGNVGIGTTTPQAKLDVAGGIKIGDVKTRTAITSGFACSDVNASITGLTCDANHQGEIRIIYNDRCARDSLCYCGRYDGAANWRWICLISCP